MQRLRNLNPIKSFGRCFKLRTSFLSSPHNRKLRGFLSNGIKHTVLLMLSLFLVGSSPYSVVIHSPSDGAHFWYGEEIRFSGSARDVQDGILSGDSLVWTSSIDGEIGTGTDFTRNLLSGGTHEITLTATNSLAEKETTTVTIEIEYSHVIAYEKMWGADIDEYLPFLRTLRDEVLANKEIGRKHIFLAYSNSLEILKLFLRNSSLIDETKEVIDGLMPGIHTLLDGGEMELSKNQLHDLKSLLTRFEEKAAPRFRNAIRKVKRDIDRGEIFEQLGIAVIESID